MLTNDQFIRRIDMLTRYNYGIAEKNKQILNYVKNKLKHNGTHIRDEINMIYQNLLNNRSNKKSHLNVNKNITNERFSKLIGYYNYAESNNKESITRSKYWNVLLRHAKKYNPKAKNARDVYNVEKQIYEKRHKGLNKPIVTIQRAYKRRLAKNLNMKNNLFLRYNPSLGALKHATLYYPHLANSSHNYNNLGNRSMILMKKVKNAIYNKKHK